MKPHKNHISLFHRAALATLLTLFVLFAVLLAFEMNAKRQHKEFFVLVDEENIEEPEPFEREKQMQEIDKSIEEMLEQEKYIDNRKNIAVNKANKPTEEQHTQTEMKKEVSEEEYRQQLIKNAIGDKEYEKFIENKPTYDESEDIEVPVNDKPTEVKKEVYTGPSNIVFYLDGREIRYIDVPVYLCQGAAEIVVKIVVLANGAVLRTQLDEENSTSTDDCFINAALNAASSARFTSGNKQKQSGKIVFRFVAQ
ncbi:MAG: hypothetical protein R6U85_11940 [Salinivirgaceae bacterium]